ncbi:DsbA family oxidoreductase [Saccharopolyspora mangrovi]|uniref:DsbA family oxidoreductase n=1 Tax=Saccharopolyspora mangrovi TaxID=3082379 RepID=UPI003899D8BF
MAFRGSYYAEDNGVGAAYYRRMLTAFFRENADLGDRTVLRDLATEVGLDPAKYDQALDASRYADRHARELQHSYDLGIQAVPTLFIGDQPSMASPLPASSPAPSMPPQLPKPQRVPRLDARALSCGARERDSHSSPLMRRMRVRAAS